jgi:restriction endonuclease Mrr
LHHSRLCWIALGVVRVAVPVDSSAEAGRALGRSGDDGVDGVVDQDALGLDRVYIQAKRYAPATTLAPVRYGISLEASTATRLPRASL